MNGFNTALVIVVILVLVYLYPQREKVSSYLSDKWKNNKAGILYGLIGSTIALVAFSQSRKNPVGTNPWCGDMFTGGARNDSLNTQHATKQCGDKINDYYAETGDYYAETGDYEESVDDVMKDE